jgi:hypothetical protein
VHLEGFHRPCAEGAARDKMDAPAVGTTAVPPEGERPPYVAFFSMAIGATAGIRTFAGRRQTVPGVGFTVTAASTGVKRGEFAAMWANCTDFCSRPVSSTPTALAVAQELLSRDAETAGAFGQDAHAARLLARFVQKHALGGKELEKFVKGQTKRCSTDQKRAEAFAFWNAPVPWPVRQASNLSASMRYMCVCVGVCVQMGCTLIRMHAFIIMPHF